MLSWFSVEGRYVRTRPHTLLGLKCLGHEKWPHIFKSRLKYFSLQTQRYQIYWNWTTHSRFNEDQNFEIMTLSWCPINKEDLQKWCFSNFLKSISKYTVCIQEFFQMGPKYIEVFFHFITTLIERRGCLFEWLQYYYIPEGF